MRNLVFATLIVGLFVSACGGEANNSKQSKEETVKRLVSLNGTITEVLFSLGVNSELVAIDVTSTYPTDTKKITNLGHVRGVTAESILSKKPTHVLVFEDELNPRLKQQLEKAKINVLVFKRDFSVESTKTVITQIGKWVNKETAAKTLIRQIDQDLKAVTQLTKSPRVLFVYARGAGTMMVAGDNTQMARMIHLAGGQNATTGFDDFKPLTAEAVVAANPAIILLFDSGKSSLNDAGGILAIPGIKMTIAGKNKAIISMDGQLLSGFGPRVGSAIAQLNSEFNQLK